MQGQAPTARPATGQVDPHRHAATVPVDRLNVLAIIAGHGKVNHSMTGVAREDVPTRLARTYPRRRIEIVEVRRMQEYKSLIGGAK